MLPTTILQTSDFIEFEFAPGSTNSLPQADLEPSVGFADILKFGAEQPAESTPHGGIGLPQAGNDLPFAATIDEGMTASPDTHDGLVEAVPSLLPAQQPLNATPVVLNPAPTGPGALPTVSAATIIPAAPASPVMANVPSEAVNSQVPPGAEVGLDLRNTRQPPTPQPVAQAAGQPMAGTDPVSQLPVHGEPLLANKQLAGTEREPVSARNSAKSEVPLASLMPARTLEPVTEARPTTIAVPEPQVLQPAPGQSLKPDVWIQPPSGGDAPQIALSSAQPGSTETTTAPRQLPAIEVPVKHEAWGSQISERVVLMAGNKLQTAEIRLTPAELGPVRIQVSLDDGAANVTFHAQHAVTREAIEQALPRLRDLLAENGVVLNQADVSEQGEQGVQHGDRDGTQDSAPAMQADAGDEVHGADQGEHAPPRVLQQVGLVDTFA